VENAFGILNQKFQIYQRTLQSLLERVDNITFATCILHNYLRYQGVGLRDLASSANVRAILQNYQTKEEMPTKVLLK
jgi:predicted nucleotide-binding protein